MSYSRFHHHVDDDQPRFPNPADDCLGSAQSRRYWREVERLERTSSMASEVQIDKVATC